MFKLLILSTSACLMAGAVASNCPLTLVADVSGQADRSLLQTRLQDKQLPGGPKADCTMPDQYISGLSDGVDRLNSLVAQPETTTLGFIHIPQNAGNAIETAALLSGIRWGFNAIQSQFFEKIQMTPDYACSWHVLPPKHLTGLQAYDSRPLFCVTRDPFYRAFSYYLFLAGMVENKCPISTPDYELFSKYQVCSPESLNNFMEVSLNKILLNGTEFDWDCNMIPQSHYIWDEQGNQVCTDLVAFKQLPGSLLEVTSKYNLSVNLEWNPPAPRGGSESVAWPCPQLEISALNEKSRALLRTVYAEDFERLGYSKFVLIPESAPLQG